MSRRVLVPAEATVQAAISDIRGEAAQRGRKPTVTALASRVGLTNATFWRHFPDLARELVDTARAQSMTPPQPESTRPRDDRAALARENRRLADHLDLAVANIARLTHENHQLRQAVEAAANVTRLNSSLER